MHALPCFRLLPSFALGILLSGSQLRGASPQIGLIILTAIFLLSLVVHRYSRFSQLSGFIIYTAVFLFGCIWAQYRIQTLTTIPLHQFSGKKIRLIAEITETPKIADWIHVKGKLLVASDQAGNTIYSKSFINLHIQKDSDIQGIEAGTVILGQTYIQPLPAVSIPFAFDYKTHLFRRGIQYQCFLSKGHWDIIDVSGNEYNLTYRANQIRTHLMDILRTYLSSHNVHSVTSAMLLGYREEISHELNRSFRQSGVIHILAVSGLHLGIISLILFGLIKLVKSRSRLAILVKAMVLLTGIWGYAFITGLPPSVLRASVMFSLIFLSKLSNRNHNMYNITAMSAMALLLWDPMMIFHIGFQFSYLAVFGILFFYPKLSGLIECKYKAVQYLWSGVCVSLAAQIPISPFSIFYFHEFPSYFWLSSPLAIPFVSLIIFGGIAILIFHPIFPALAKLTAIIHQIVVDLLLKLTESIGNMPYAMLQDMALSGWGLIILMACIFSIIGFIISKYPGWWIPSLALIGVFYLLSLFYQKRANKSIHAFIYDHPSMLTGDFIVGKTGYSLIPGQQSGNFALAISKNNRIHRGVAKNHSIRLEESFEDNRLQLDRRMIEFENTIFYFPVNIHKFILKQVDYPIIDRSTVPDPAIDYTGFSCTYILHPSAGIQWKELLPDSQIHDMSHSGYFHKIFQ